MEKTILSFPFNTFVKGSGLQSIAAGAYAEYSGFNGSSPRRAFIITNLSSADFLYLCRGQTEFLAVPAATDAAHPTLIIIETSDDIVVRAPATASADVDYIVGEIFAQGSPEQAAAERPGLARSGGSFGIGTTGGGSFVGSGSFGSPGRPTTAYQPQ